MIVTLFGRENYNYLRVSIIIQRKGFGRSMSNEMYGRMVDHRDTHWQLHTEILGWVEADDHGYI